MPIDVENFPKEKIKSKARDVGRGLQYPVNDFGDLARKIGREEIEVEGEKERERIRISNLRKHFTQEYFPIRDAQDFENKIDKLYDKEVIKQPGDVRKDQIPSFPEKLKRVKPSKGEAGGRIEKIEQESS